jgi:hypothetical protein
MNNHQLPCDLMQHVKHFDQYKLVATLGVDEKKQMHKFAMYLHHDNKQTFLFRSCSTW